MDNKKLHQEFPFVPRIINPVKIAQAILLSADAQIRESLSVLLDFMPWIKTDILSSPQAASDYICNRDSVFLFDDTAMALVNTDRIRKNNKNSVLVLLSSNPFIHRFPPQEARKKYPYTEKADLIFAVSRTELVPPLIITSVVRAAEDLINIRTFSEVRRFIFLIVDDEPRWFSQFLPVLYNIIGQRADVMLARTYEESLTFLFGVERESDIDDKEYRAQGYGDDVVCLIADIFFPRGNDLNNDAGKDLIQLTSRYYPRIPIIIASKAKEAENLKDRGFLLPKGDPGSLEKLKDYILDFTGLGDFLVSDGHGHDFCRVKNIHELYDILLKAEKDTPQGQRLREILETYGQNDKFSTWLYMHSYRELGDLLRPKRSKGRRLIQLLKTHLQQEIMRMNFTPLTIDKFKVFSLQDLLNALQTLPSEKIQPYSDNDIISSWLDRKGYPDLAEELRPIHGSGAKLRETLVYIVDKWMKIYMKRGRTHFHSAP